MTYSMDEQEQRDLEAYWAQQAIEEHQRAHAAWREERLADDPDLAPEDVDEEAYDNYLVVLAEDAVEEASWARGCDRGSWSRRF